MTLKAVYKDGSEQIIEVKRVGYVHGSRTVDFVDCDGPGQLLMDDRVLTVYVMNSAGSTVGKYHQLELSE